MCTLEPGHDSPRLAGSAEGKRSCRLPMRNVQWLVLILLGFWYLLFAPMGPSNGLPHHPHFSSKIGKIRKEVRQRVFGIGLGPGDLLTLPLASLGGFERHYAGEHDGMPLVDFIKEHVGPSNVWPAGRGLWMTLADEVYVRDFLSHARLYLDDLSPRPAFPRHDLVVICLDTGCMREARKRRMLPYGGFMHDENRPHFVRNDTWAKASSLAQTLSAGYHTVFFDADVFYRWDVFEKMVPLNEDTWDLQIQEESHEAQVNTGFMFTRANSKTANLWQAILARVRVEGDRDQAKVNDYLEASAKRKLPDNKRLMQFVSPTGLRTQVLDPEFFWGMHMGWFTNAETTILHLTCAPLPLKSIIAASHSFLHDVDGLYSNPPRLISLGGSMAGSQQDIADLFRLLLAAGLESDRAVVPPLNGHFIGPANDDDGNIGDHSSGNITHTRFIWSLFDLEPLLRPSSPVQLLEPNYPEHATRFLQDDLDTLSELHMVRELDLRPVTSYANLLQRLSQPYYRDAHHVRLMTDEGPRGYKSVWGRWERDFPAKIPQVRLCRSPERVSQCGDLCRQ